MCSHARSLPRCACPQVLCTFLGLTLPRLLHPLHSPPFHLPRLRRTLSPLSLTLLVRSLASLFASLEFVFKLAHFLLSFAFFLPIGSRLLLFDSIMQVLLFALPFFVHVAPPVHEDPGTALCIPH